VITVIYARSSSGLQRAASIEDQIRLCRARIELARFISAAWSGTRLRYIKDPQPESASPA
jgi:hypothetical protein